VRDWDFDGQLVKTLKISGVILLFLFFALFYKPGDPVIMGFLLGVAAGMWNAFFLGRRLRSIVQMAVPKASAHMKAGFALRLSIIFAVLFFVARTNWINLYAAGTGLFIVPVVFTIGAVSMAMGTSSRKPEKANSLK